MVIALEHEVRRVQPARTLDIDLLGTVHHDLGDCVVCQQGLDWAIAQNLCDNCLKEPLTLGPAEHQILLGQDLVKELLDRLADLIRPRHIHLGVKLGDQLILDASLDIPVWVPTCRHRLPTHTQLAHL
jgi:hypothetical protein